MSDKPTRRRSGWFESGAKSEDDLIPTVKATCNGGHRVECAQSAIGKSCGVCERTLRPVDRFDEAIRRHEESRRAP